MKKPFQTDAKPDQQPNEPKMYPGQQGMSKSGQPNGSLDGFAEKAKVQPPNQLKHVAVPIDSEHILGKAQQDPKQLHVDTKMKSSAKMPSFADQEKIAGSKVKSGLKSPKA